jgi:hypothetical protein
VSAHVIPPIWVGAKVSDRKTRAHGQMRRAPDELTLGQEHEAIMNAWSSGHSLGRAT